MLRAGVVGLGAMGGGIAVCLARTQRQLSVYDIDPKAALKWDDGDLVPPVKENCAEVARQSDVVMIVVVSADQVWSVLNGSEGLLAGAHSDLVIVVCSTISMAELNKMQQAVAEAGATLVDCGVTCPPREHTKKRIIGMVGATADVYDKIKNVLGDFTQKVLLMGEPGAGMTTKIVRNMMYYASWRAAFEAKKLADGMGGINLPNMAEINALSEADGSGSTFWLNQWAAGNYHPTGNQPKREHITDGMVKDLSAAAELADIAGLDASLEIPILDVMLRSPEDVTSAWSNDK